MKFYSQCFKVETFRLTSDVSLVKTGDLNEEKIIT